MYGKICNADSLTHQVLVSQKDEQTKPGQVTLISCGSICSDVLMFYAYYDRLKYCYIYIDSHYNNRLIFQHIFGL